jgi:hypothetical protein
LEIVVFFSCDQQKKDKDMKKIEATGVPTAQQNGISAKTSPAQIYESVSPIEESYSTTRQRVFIGSNNN